MSEQKKSDATAEQPAQSVELSTEQLDTVAGGAVVLPRLSNPHLPAGGGQPQGIIAILIGL